MIATAQTLPYGDSARITWIAAPIETAPLRGPYALIVAAASLHWMDCEQTLPRFAAHLVPGGVLVIVEEYIQPKPGDTEIGPIISRYSMNKDYTPYNMSTIVAELEQRRLFELVGRYETAPVSFEQPVNAWIEAFHARNGFSRDRMDPQAATAFDQELRQIVAPYCPQGIVEQWVAARILWGYPCQH